MRAVVRSSSEIRWSACRVGLNKYRSGAPESADLDTGILIGRLHFFEMPQDTVYSIQPDSTKSTKSWVHISAPLIPHFSQYLCAFHIFRLVDQTRPSISWKVKSKSTISKCWSANSTYLHLDFYCWVGGGDPCGRGVAGFCFKQSKLAHFCGVLPVTALSMEVCPHHP